MNLDGEIAPIDIVPKEQITRFSGIATDFKQLHEVILVGSSRV